MKGNKTKTAYLITACHDYEHLKRFVFVFNDNGKLLQILMKILELNL